MKTLSAIACGLIVCSLPGAAGADYYDGRVVTMTRNVYIGADIFRVVEADPLNVLNVIIDVYDTVQQTDYHERAEVLADEVMAVRPHLIGLQEVTLLRRQSPGDILTIGNVVPNAEDVEADYLQILLDAMAARGLFYTPAAVVVNADVEVPLVVAQVGVDDIRITDRDVILVRDDVAVTNVLERNYRSFVSFDLSGIAIEFRRGYVAVDATVRNRSYRFVNTHLEVGSQPKVQALQVGELIDELDDEPLPVILLGDFNSAPGGSPASPYARLVEEGFVDVWTERRGSPSPGHTCCHDETLDNAEPSLVERIDHVFVRAGTVSPRTGNFVDRVVAITLGDQQADRTASGLWPSDHAGVAVMMSIFLDLAAE